ncbi:HIT domain-containing protein [Rhodoferax sp.]|uniref:HIT domain-containing protein n=1 Tax=Rhodoferax sp. TaxID=50421 RepID=UPI00344DFD68
MRRAISIAITFAVGIALGGWLFSRTIPRSFLAASTCESSCYKPNDLVGLLASAVIQQTSNLIPSVGESNECVAVKHPRPEGRVHLVFFPKRDVRNILELQPEDSPYVLGCFALARELAKREGVLNYRLYTNGPALQHVTYLHFHFVAK